MLRRDKHEYLLCAVIVERGDETRLRAAVEPFLLRGQLKFHWKVEPERRRKSFLAIVAAMDFEAIVIIDTSVSQHHQERQRRKALELLYAQLEALDVTDVTLEGRTATQDRLDINHIAGLKSAGVFTRVRLTHMRGGDEPLLWIPDALLGVTNANRGGNDTYRSIVTNISLVVMNTAGSD